jgi:hypothetical protein
MLGRKWKPKYASTPPVDEPPMEVKVEPMIVAETTTESAVVVVKKKKKGKGQALSTKSE